MPPSVRSSSSSKASEVKQRASEQGRRGEVPVVGTKRTEFPRRMGRKLLAIRRELDLTMPQMFALIEPDRKRSKGDSGAISNYEKGKRQVPLLRALRYARIAGIPLEMLVDDAIDLDLKAVERGVAEYLAGRVKKV